MKHKDVEYKLSELVDGNLPEVEAEQLHGKLASDPELTEELRLYRAVDDVLAGEGEEMPEIDWGFQRESIRGVLEREALLRPAGPTWPGRLVRWTATAAGVMAAAAAIVLVAVNVLSPTLPENPPEVEVALLPPADPAGPESLTVSVIEPDADQQPSVEVSYAVSGDIPPSSIDVASAFGAPTQPRGTIVISTAARRSGRARASVLGMLADLQ